MGRTACREHQCLYKGALHLFHLIETSGVIVAERLSFVYSAEENLGGHKLKDNRQVVTFVTGWLITEDRY